MRIPKGRLRGEYDASKHIQLHRAAEKAGYSTHHFANTIAPAYRIQSYTDGTQVFFDKAMFDKALPKIARKVTASGSHAPGSLPKVIKKKVRSDFGKRNARKGTRKPTAAAVKRVAAAVSHPANDGIPVVDVVMSRAVFESLVAKGKIRPKFIVTD